MRVLHFLKSNIYSGAEHVVCTIIHNMPDDVESYYVSPEGPISTRLQNEGIRHIKMECMNVKEIRKIVKKYQPDIVHAHDFTASVMVALSCRSMQFTLKKEPKVISHLHCNPLWLRKRNLKTVLYRVASRWMDEIITVSDAVMEDYVYGKHMKNRVVTLGNPFSIAEILLKINDATLDEKHKTCDVLYVGRLSEAKNPIGFLRIIEALRLRNGMSDVHAIMIGDGEMYDMCEKYIEDHSMHRNVTMIGFQDNPYIYMKSTRVLIMPSEWEGFGLVALEAMSMGVPVVCSGAGGLREIVDETCGKVIDVKWDNQMEQDIISYAEETERLLEDQLYYQSKSDGARRRAKAYDNVKEYVEQLKKIYCNV